jgi:hypothetical protein
LNGCSLATFGWFLGFVCIQKLVHDVRQGVGLVVGLSVLIRWCDKTTCTWRPPCRKIHWQKIKTGTYTLWTCFLYHASFFWGVPNFVNPVWISYRGKSETKWTRELLQNPLSRETAMHFLRLLVPSWMIETITPCCPENPQSPIPISIGEFPIISPCLTCQSQMMTPSPPKNLMLILIFPKKCGLFRDKSPKITKQDLLVAPNHQDYAKILWSIYCGIIWMVFLPYLHLPNHHQISKPQSSDTIRSPW